VAAAELTGLLLLGGASVPFGSPKALARLHGETLAERAWRTLGEVCEHRLALGKAADRLELPFPVLDDGSDERAAIIGLAAGLRAAPTDLCVALPIDCPAMTAVALLELADGCAGDAAVPQTGPLPGPTASGLCRRSSPASARSAARWNSSTSWSCSLTRPCW
jgi:molybdopterin-guanine dinucleotide biosynthesis protein A